MKNSRLALYVVYDPDSMLDTYRKFYIEKLLPFVDKFVCVVCGDLRKDDQKWLEKQGVELYIRDNRGLLTYAWIDGISYIGWDQISQYDQLLMLNDSFFGPVFDLRDFFAYVDSSEADFVGAIKNFPEKQLTGAGGHKFKHGHLRGSICYFYVIKERLLRSSFFRRYWTSQPRVDSYFDQTFFNEFDFYDEVVDNGFRVDSYQSDDMDGYCFNALSFRTKDLVQKEQVPFIRIRPFGSAERLASLEFGYGNDAKDCLTYLESHTTYDTDMMWDFLLRTKHMTDIFNQLGLAFVIDDKKIVSEQAYNKKIAVIIHLYYEDMIADIRERCESFPENTDFYISTTDENKKRLIEEAFSNKNVSVVIRPNIGGEAPTPWVTFSHVFCSDIYDYCCYFHAKKSKYFSHEIIGDEFAKRCYDNLFSTAAYVQNIINLFETNPRLGLVGAPMVYHNAYFESEFRSWWINFENTKELAEQLKLHVPISIDKVPVAPYGCMFWCRTSALKKAISHNFTYDDFNVPYKPDGTFMHAIERIYTFAAQDSGYYYATVSTPTCASIDLVNYKLMLDSVIGALAKKGIPPYSFSFVLSQIESGVMYKASTLRKVKDFVQKWFPRPIVHFLRVIYRKIS